MAENVTHQNKTQDSAPAVKDYHRYKRCNYLSGLPIGEDPQIEADLKEQQRRQWLADLEQQVKERRIARECERLKNLQLDSVPSRGTQGFNATLSTDSAYNEVKSTNYGRGRGLADLMGRQASDSATKRQQQQELKEAYAEQMREREERRQKEREAEAKADAAAEEAIRLEIERERRLIEEQELKLAQRRRQTEICQERVNRTAVENNKKPQISTKHTSRSSSQIPRPTNRSTSQPKNKLSDLEIVKKAQFGSTYTLSNPTRRPNDYSNEARNHNRIQKNTPAIIRTESTLMPSKSPLPNRLTSDFLSAISDPDFAYPQESRDSALREVSRIKENLTKRQNELRTMQQM